MEKLVNPFFVRSTFRTSTKHEIRIDTNEETKCIDIHIDNSEKPTLSLSSSDADFLNKKIKEMVDYLINR
jgi:hypothetical protein